MRPRLILSWVFFDDLHAWYFIFILVRNRAKELVELLSDVEKIRGERRKAKANKSKYVGVGNDGGYGSGGMSSSFGGGGGRYGGFGSDSVGGGGGSSYGNGKSRPMLSPPLFWLVLTISLS